MKRETTLALLEFQLSRFPFYGVSRRATILTTRAIIERVKVASLTIALTLAACAAPPVAPPPAPPALAPAPVKEVPASALVDHLGDSVETAAEVPADVKDEGVRFENDFIYDRVGRFRRLNQGTGTLYGRRYDVIEVETPNHDKHKYYFDITEMWKKWAPPQ